MKDESELSKFELYYEDLRHPSELRAILYRVKHRITRMLGRHAL